MKCATLQHITVIKTMLRWIHLKRIGWIGAPPYILIDSIINNACLSVLSPSPKPEICKQCVIRIVGEKSLWICVSGDVRVCWFQADKKEEPRPGMTAVGQLVGGAAHPISHFIRCRNLPLPITLVITNTTMARSGCLARRTSGPSEREIWMGMMEMTLSGRPTQ